MIHWEKWCDFVLRVLHLGVSENNGTPKSSILIGFSITNHPFWGTVPIFGTTHFEFDPKCFHPEECNSKVWVVSDVKIPTRYCWWLRNSVKSPVEVGSLSHYLYGFYIPGGYLGFLNHQKYPINRDSCICFPGCCICRFLAWKLSVQSGFSNVQELKLTDKTCMMTLIATWLHLSCSNCLWRIGWFRFG